MVTNGPEYRIPFFKGIEAVAVMEFLKNPTLNSKKFDFKTATLSQYFKSAHEYEFDNGYSVSGETIEIKNPNSTSTPYRTIIWSVTLTKNERFKREYLEKLEVEYKRLNILSKNLQLNITEQEDSIATLKTVKLLNHIHLNLLNCHIL